MADADGGRGRWRVLKDRRVLALGGGGVALAAGLAVAFLLVRTPNAAHEAPPASQGGLVVQTGRDDDIKLDPMRPLRCFVGGQFVGELPLGACAKRNGVATGALDVGVDPSGALAASNGPTGEITPLPPARVDAAQPAVSAVTDDSQGAPARSAACWTYDDGAWNRLPGELTQSACAAQISHRCFRPDQSVFYARWGEQTLRNLAARGAVEYSLNNHDFRFLIDADGRCAKPE